MEYASNAKANTAVTLGAIGTGLGILGSGIGLLNPLSGNVEDRHVTRHEMDLIRELMDSKQANAILTSENDTERKLVEVYNALAKQDKEINAKIDANYKEQIAINRDQAVYNGVNTATLNCMQSKIDELLALTARKVPNTSVCPGWGEVKITPAQ